MKLKQYSIIIVLNLAFSYSILSNENINSFSYSISAHRDNESYHKVANNNNVELIRYSAYLYQADFSFVIKKSYELSLIYFYNSEAAVVETASQTNSINAFMLPVDGPYGFIKFNYHFKEKEKFPLNLFFGIQYGKYLKDNLVGGYRKYDFNVGLYKEFKQGNYPIIPYLEFVSSKYSILPLVELQVFNNKDSYFLSKIGFFIKMPVENLSNDSARDIIWINSNISLVDKDLYFGVNLGLSHPF